METTTFENVIATLKRRNEILENREREYRERTEELLAIKEELTAAIEAFMDKSDVLEQTVKTLSERNFELDQILYRTSHDLRSPVATIEGLLNLVPISQRTPAVTQIHKHILDQAGKMKDILSSIGGLESVAMNCIKIETIDLDQCLWRVVRELDYLENYKIITFHFSYSKPLFIQGDYSLFSVVLKALISNAIIYRSSDREGVVIITASVENETLNLTVTDDGDGIQEEFKDKVFEMFFRGSDRSKGSGLGLYTARKIITRFSGKISVSSNQNLTSFSINLPTNCT